MERAEQEALFFQKVAGVHGGGYIAVPWPRDKTMVLDGCFTPTELRAIADAFDDVYGTAKEEVGHDCPH